MLLTVLFAAGLPLSGSFKRMIQLIVTGAISVFVIENETESIVCPDTDVVGIDVGSNAPALAPTPNRLKVPIFHSPYASKLPMTNQVELPK